MVLIEKTLEYLGFSPNEVKVYLALNDHGSIKAGKVAKLAKIERSSCYNSLKSLAERGLVSYVLIGRVKWFQATGPKRLLDYVKEQEENVKEILPALHARPGLPVLPAFSVSRRFITVSAFFPKQLFKKSLDPHIRFSFPCSIFNFFSSQTA